MAGRLQEIFEQVVGLTAAERDPYIRGACGADAALRDEIGALLRAHDQAATFLASPTGRAPGSAPTIVAPIRECPGERIGPYKLLQQIGEGGFGEVWEAEQREPVRRRVALKIVKTGMDSKEALARFEAERQALALMDHPNVAHVFDAGTTANGRPFVVMEHAPGLPITDYCDAARLPIRRRLELFIPICHAVQHAHTKGIIHRDLKPSNILVTLLDGEPVPKVIDFGIAKATAAPLTDRTLCTRIGGFIGTPEYMSPEQAGGGSPAGQGRALDIDTRSDIYSLGVILYQLLTGTLPFDPRTLHEADLAGLARIIRELEPDKPSTRLSTLSADPVTQHSGATPQDISARRSTDYPALQRQLRGELDWIVMKCLEKDRAQRYETASGLAADVERHLAGEPVLAAPPSKLYKLRKALRRHRIPVAAATAILLALAGGAVVSTVLWQRAEANAAAAARQAEETELAATLLADMIGTTDPRETKIPNEVMRQRLDKFAATSEPKLAGHPDVEARVRQSLGGAYLAIGETAKAERQLARALALTGELYGPEHPRVAAAISDWAWLLREKSDFPAAEAAFRESLALRRRLLGDEHIVVADSRLSLAQMLNRTGESAEAKAQLDEAIPLFRKLLGIDSTRLAIGLQEMSDALAGQGDFIAAEPYLVEALRIDLTRKDDDPVSAIKALNNLAQFRAQRGRCSEALPHYRDALTLARERLGNDDPLIALVTHHLADCLLQLGQAADADDAGALAAESVALYRGHLEWDPFEHVHALGVLAKVHARAGDIETMLDVHREQVRFIDQYLPRDDLRASGALGPFGMVLVQNGHFAEAEPILRKCLALREAQVPQDSREYWLVHNTRSLLGHAILGQVEVQIATDRAAALERLREAEPLIVESYGWLNANPERMNPAWRAQRIREAGERVIKLYELREVADPGHGSIEKAAAVRAELEKPPEPQ